MNRNKDTEIFGQWLFDLKQNKRDVINGRTVKLYFKASTKNRIFFKASVVVHQSKCTYTHASLTGRLVWSVAVKLLPCDS